MKVERNLLLLLCENDLFSFALALLKLLGRMLPFILFPPLDGGELLALDLRRLLHNLGQMPMAPDAADLRKVRISVR